MDSTKRSEKLNKKLDPFFREDKENLKRLKALLSFLGSANEAEQRVFFHENYFSAYAVMLESFIVVEGNIMIKASRDKEATDAQIKELGEILNILQKILLFVPDVIGQRWQMNSIGKLLEKLLASGNQYKLRLEGFRLLLLFLEDLGVDHASPKAHELFRNAIGLSPFVNTESSILLEQTPIMTTDGLSLVPQQPAECASSLQQSVDMISNLGDYLGTKVGMGTDKEVVPGKSGPLIFELLFELLKKHYMTALYPEACKEIGLVDENSVYGFPMCPKELQAVLVPLFVKWTQTTSERFHAIRQVLYASRQNVFLMHDVFKQAFQLPPTHSQYVNMVIGAYRQWITCGDEKPLFMQEPDLLIEMNSVKMGIQVNLKRFIAYSAQVFHVNPSSSLLERHVMTCRNVLSFYQCITMEKITMEMHTWEFLLNQLLEITVLMVASLPEDTSDSKTLSEELMELLLETLLVSWIRAHMIYTMNERMWHSLLRVLSESTHCSEVIRQWRSIMAQLTKFMVYACYNIHLDDLPLDRAQKEAGARARIRAKTQAIADEEPTAPSAVEGVSVLGQSNNIAQNTVDARIHGADADAALLSATHRSFTNINDLEWTPFRALFLWRNMLSILGNVNRISQPVIHADCIRGLTDVWTTLHTVRANQGVSLDNTSTPPVPRHLPPLFEFTTWLFEACNLPDEFSSGRAMAYALLCRMLARRHAAIPPPSHYLTHFYRCVHSGLSASIQTNGDTSMLHEIVHNCSLFFSYVFPGATILVVDFVKAIREIMWGSGSERFSNVRLREDAVTLLCSLIPFPNLYSDTTVPALSSGDGGVLNTTPVDWKQVKDEIFTMLRHIAMQEPITKTRSMAVFGIGIAVVEELSQGSKHAAVKECVEVLISLVVFDDQEIALKAVSMLAVLSEYASEIETYPSLLTRVLEGITFAIYKLFRRLIGGEAVAPVVTALFFLLLDWLMAVSSDILYKTQTAKHVFSVLEMVILAGDSLGLTLHAEHRSSSRVSAIVSSPTKEVPPMKTPDALSKDAMSKVVDLVNPVRAYEATRDVLEHSFRVFENGLKVPFSNRRTKRVPTVAEDPASGGSNANAGVTIGGGGSATVVNNAVDNNLLTVNNASGTNGPDMADVSSPPFGGCKADLRQVSLAANTVLSHLINNLNNFPSTAGVSQLNSLVCESDDLSEFGGSELTPEVFKNSGVQFFVYNDHTLISMIELPVESGRSESSSSDAKTRARIILRDMTGKYCWDWDLLYQARNLDVKPPSIKRASSNVSNPSDSYHDHDSRGPSSRSSMVIPLSVATLVPISEPTSYPGIVEKLEVMPPSQAALDWMPQPRTMFRYVRSPKQIPIFRANSGCEDVDMLDEVLQYVGETSPECLHFQDTPLNVPYPTPSCMTDADDVVKDTLLAVESAEVQYLYESETNPSHNMVGVPVRPPDVQTPVSPFHHCRLMLSHLGLLSWENRRHFHLLSKDDNLIRRLRSLDNSGSREYHKVGVVYVAHGQEDECSILANSCGSQAYENFLAALGWEVDLGTHKGYMGGLDPKLSTGKTTPYYAKSTLEIIFHVTTRMPTAVDDPKQLKKKRHIGNDSVLIIWTEHERDWRKEIIKTRFNDALIIIYPIPNGLFRVEVECKDILPEFGPLFSGVLVNMRALGPLVRETAINASRACSSLLEGFQEYYEQRDTYVNEIITHHKRSSTFEDFLSTALQPTNRAMRSAVPICPFHTVTSNNVKGGDGCNGHIVAESNNIPQSESTRSSNKSPLIKRYSFTTSPSISIKHDNDQMRRLSSTETVKHDLSTSM